jgi:hypothetical protein
MNIETLIELLLVAKSKDITQVDIIDQDFYNYTIESIDLNEGASGKRVLIQVEIDC